MSPREHSEGGPRDLKDAWRHDTNAGRGKPRRAYGLRPCGFCSGIDSAKHYGPLLDFVDALPRVSNQKAFIFSTCGVPGALVGGEMLVRQIAGNHAALRQKLRNKGYVIIDEFGCVGFNTNSFLKLLGGLNRGRPNADDLRCAEEFAEDLEKQDRQPAIPKLPVQFCSPGSSRTGDRVLNRNATASDRGKHPFRYCFNPALSSIGLSAALSPRTRPGVLRHSAGLHLQPVEPWWPEADLVTERE
jgi:hypothetical protein